MVSEDLLDLQKYCEQFILLWKHHIQITEAGFQVIVIWSETGKSENDTSTNVSLPSIDIVPIKCDVLKQF